MGDFNAKITATVDTSKAEAQLNALTKDKKVNIQANVNGNGVDNLNSGIQQAQKSANGLSASFKEIAGTKLKYDVINAIKNQAESAAKAVTDLNEAMTKVSMTMSNMTDAALNSLKQQSIDMARELSVYTKTVTDAITIYANENESAASMLSKAQPTVLLASASEMSASAAADAIQGIMNQFSLAEDQAMHVADVTEKLSSEIALDFSRGCDTISKAVSVSGSVVNEAGMDFEKYAAIVSTVAEDTRLSGSTIGNAFKTIFSRISRSKDGLTTAAEMSDAEEAFKSVGVSVRGADGDLRDVSDTLDDLNAVWGTLNKSQKSYISEQAAGVRQKNMFISMMDNYDKALKLEQDALNSSGTAMKVNEKRADSINGKLEKLSATMTELYSDVLPGEAIEDMLDFATAIAEVADRIGLLQGVLAGLGVAGGAQVIGALAVNWTKLVSAFTSPVGIASVAVGGLVAAISAYRKSVEESVESARQAGSAWEDTNTSLQGYIDKITELRTELDSGNLTEQEAYEAKSQLLDIQNQLSESYGSQVEGINLVNGSLEEQISLLNQLSQSEAQRFLNENQKGIAEAEKQLSKQLGTQPSFFGKGGYFLGQYYNNGTEEADILNSILKKYKDVIDVEGGKIEKYIYFRGDATQANEVLNSLMTDITNAQKEIGETSFMDDILSNAGSGLDEANEIIDKYKDLADQAAQARLVADTELFKSGNKNQTAAQWLKDYATAIEDYNNAIALGDDSEIAKTAESFAKIDAQVNGLLNKTDMSAFTDQFTELREQLNESGIALNEFNKALSGEETDKYQESFKSVVEEIKKLNFSDVDFKAAVSSGDIESINYLSEAAKEAGISTDDLTRALVELGIISGQPAAAVTEVAEEIQSVSEIISGDTISDAVSTYTSKISTLKSAQEELNKTGKLSASTTKDLYENISNASDYADDFAGNLDKMVEAADSDLMAAFNDEIEKLQRAGDYSGADALRQYAQSVIESASEIEGAYQRIGELKIETPQMQAVEEAANTDNGGKVYEDMLSKYKTALELYKGGFTGTDDFKSFAAMISPTGSDDAANFAENIGKFNRYFTEGSEGCQNFLADLKELGYAEQDGSKWTYNLGNNMQELKAAAEQMGIGFEPFMAMFGRLEDYGAYNDFFVTEEQGTQHLNSLYKDLAAEKQRLAEIEANPRTSNYETARQESLDKIAQYEERIAQTKKDINNLDATNAEYMKEKAEYSKNVAQSMLDEINATNDDALKQSLKDQLDSFAEEYHLKINYDTGSITNLEEAVENIDFKVNLDATGSDLDNQISGLSAYLAELRSGGEVGLDTSQISDAEALLSYLVERKQQLEQPAVMAIDSSQLDGANDKLASAITAIQNFQTAYNELQKAQALGIDTSEAEANLQSAKSELDSIDKSTEKVLNFEINGDEDVETIIDKIQNLDLSALDTSVQNLSYHFDLDNKEELDDIVAKIENLPKDTQNVTVVLNTDDVDETELTNLTTALDSLPKTTKTITVTLNTDNADPAKLDVINTGLGKIAQTHPNSTVTVNGEGAISIIDLIQGKLNDVDDTHPNPVISASDQASSTIRSVSSQLSSLDGKTAHTYVYTHNVPVGETKLHGNAKAQGNARASGYKGEPKDIVALAGEVKPELVVRDNQYFTVGDDGPEMFHFRKGDIIFDGDQTEDILKRGHTRRRGRALAKGNARSGGIDWGKSGNNGGSGSSSGKTTTTKTTTTKDVTPKDTSDEDKSKIDWIEKALDRINQRINRIKTNVSNIYRSFADRRKSLKSELSYTQKELDAQEKAYKKYLKYADNVELSDSIKKKIRHGSYFIGEYDEDTQKLIQEYEDYYKKALDCKDATYELKNSLAELARERFDLVIQEWTDKLIDLEHAAESLNSLISRRSAYASEYVTSDNAISASKNNILDYQELVLNAKNQISTKLGERDALKQQLANMLADENSGITFGSEGYNEMVRDIQEIENDIDSLNSDIISYSNSISEEYVNMFDTISKEYENKLDMAGHLANEYNNALEKAEAKGLITTSAYYEELQKIEQNNIAMLTEQADAMRKSMYEALSTGEIEIGSQAYYDMNKQINDVVESIQEAEKAVIEYGNSIRQVKWDQFDYTRDRVADLNDEIEFMISLMEDAKLVDDKGFFTNEGMATIGMYGTEYNTLMAEADEYADEIMRINEEIANDPSDTKLIERKNELLQKQRELILSANDQKQAIKDLVEDGINAQLDSLKELISTYTDALDRQKDLYDFQKKIEEQTKNITKLEKELTAYENDFSEETKAKVQQIKVELEEARNNLEETQYENYISEQKKILDDLYDEYEKVLNERLDNLDVLMEEMIATANANAATINDTLVSSAENVGYTMSESLNSIWGSAQSSMVSNTQTLLSELVNNGKISKGNADSIIKALGTGSANEIAKTQEVIDKLIANGLIATSDASTIRDTINAQTNEGSVLAVYGRDFRDNQTTTNSVLGTIKSYVSSLVAEAERQAEEERLKIQQEELARQQAEEAAKKAAESNTSNTKQDAEDATKVTVPPTTVENAPVVTNPPTTNNPTNTPTTPATKPPTSTSTQGDGKIQVGDKVKFNSGSYYYSSDGLSPVGSDYRGQQVYITSINTASWATKPYHISTGKKLGSGDLGWVSKSQISGYASGTKRVPTDELGWTQEFGNEMIIRPTENAVLTPLKGGDAVLNAEATKTMYEFANNPRKYMSTMLPSIPSVADNGNPYNINNNLDNITFNLPNVSNYDEFLYRMQHDSRFERLVQAMTTDQIAGKNRFEKYKINFLKI